MGVTVKIFNDEYSILVHYKFLSKSKIHHEIIEFFNNKRRETFFSIFLNEIFKNFSTFYKPVVFIL